MKAPPKRKGNIAQGLMPRYARGLNESPSEKEGKSGGCTCGTDYSTGASMKAPPKRKGNYLLYRVRLRGVAPQ